MLFAVLGRLTFAHGSAKMRRNRLQSKPNHRRPGGRWKPPVGGPSRRAMARGEKVSVVWWIEQHQYFVYEGRGGAAGK